MKIGQIQSILPKNEVIDKSNDIKNKQFSNILTDFVSQVNKDQMDSSELTKGFIAGDDVEIHDVMIAGEKAQTSLDLLLELRNKTIDMYTELTRMR